MRFIQGLTLYFYKILFLFLFFPIGGMLIIAMFGNNIIGNFFFAACLLLLSVMKFEEFLKDPDFDFNTFVLVILVIPIIIDFLFKMTYQNFNFFENIAFTYDVLFKYLYNFFENNMEGFFRNLKDLDSELKKFYIASIAFFILMKYFISQLLSYLWHLDYLLIIIFIYRLFFK